MLEIELSQGTNKGLDQLYQSYRIELCCVKDIAFHTLASHIMTFIDIMPVLIYESFQNLGNVMILGTFCNRNFRY